MQWTRMHHKLSLGDWLCFCLSVVVRVDLPWFKGVLSMKSLCFLGQLLI